MIWLSGMFFHGARFSNYEAWVANPMQIKPSAQLVWPIVGQEVLNGDVGGGFQGVQITSGFFQLWRGAGITSELQLFSTAIGGLILAGKASTGLILLGAAAVASASGYAAAAAIAALHPSRHHWLLRRES